MAAAMLLGVPAVVAEDQITKALEPAALQKELLQGGPESFLATIYARMATTARAYERWGQAVASVNPPPGAADAQRKLQQGIASFATAYHEAAVAGRKSQGAGPFDAVTDALTRRDSDALTQGMSALAGGSCFDITSDLQRMMRLLGLSTSP